MKKRLLGLLVLSCLLFLGVKKADAATTLVVVATTATTTVSPTTVPYGATAAVFGFSATSNTVQTLNQVVFTVPKAATTDNPAANMSLWSSSTSNYNTSSTLQKVTTGTPAVAVGGTNSTITFTATAFNAIPLPVAPSTVSIYYFLVITFNTNATLATLPDPFAYSLTSVTSKSGATNINATGDSGNGSTFNFIADGITQDQTTGGLTTSLPSAPATNVALFGLKLTATAGSTTLSGLTFTATQAISSLFSGNVTLYSSSSPSFSIATATPVKTVATTTLTTVGATISFTGFTQAFITTPAATTIYYYVVIDNYVNPPTASGQSIEIDLTGKTFTLNTTVTLATGSDATGTPVALTPIVVLGALSPVLPNATLNTNQTDVPISGFSITTAKNLTFTTFNFTTPGLPVNGAFSNVQLYIGSTSNYATAVLSAPIPCTYNTGTDVLTITGGQLVNAGATPLYFYIKADYTPPATSGSFNLNLTSASVGATNYTNGAPKNGPTITCNTSVTLGTVAGLSATTLNTDQITTPTSAVPVTGFAVTTSQATTFNSFTFSNTGTLPLSGPFSDIQVFIGNTNNYGTVTSFTQVTGTFNPTTNVFTPLVPLALTAGTTSFYIKANFTAPVTSGGTVKINLTGAVSGAITYATNAPIAGPLITCNTPVTIATAIATSLSNMAPNPLPNSITATNLPIMAFKVTTTQDETFNKFTLTASSANLSTYFSGFTLYAGSSGDASAATQVSGASFAITGTSVIITGITQLQHLGTLYYFIVPTNYVAPASATIEIDANSVATAANTYATGAPALGTLYYLGVVTYDWAGTVNSGGYHWANALNWTVGGNPAPSYPGAGGTTKDIVQIGNISASYTSGHEPTIVAGDPAITVASITFGSNNGNDITLTANNTLTVTGDIKVQADRNTDNAQSNIFGIPYGPGNIYVYLAGSSTIKTSNIQVLSTVDSWGQYGDAGSDYDEILNSSVNYLNVTGSAGNGNIILSSTYNTLVVENYYSATFNVSGGTTNVDGVFKSTNTRSTLNSLGNTNKATSYFTTTGGTLILTNAAAMPTATTSHGSGGLDIVGINTIDFTAGGTVSYAGTSQTIYADANINPVTAGPSYNSISFSTPTTGIKTLTGGNLNVGGDFTNLLANDATSKVPLTGNQVNFNGTSAQKLYGGAGTGTIFKNVAFSGNSTKTMSTGTFTVINAGTLNVGATGTGNTSTLTVGGSSSLTLNSDSTGTATVGQVFGTITGNVNAQRSVSGGAGWRGYRLFSPPININGKTVQTGTTNEAFVDPTYLNLGMLTAGPNGTSGGWDVANTNPLMYLYDESRASNRDQFFSGKNVGLSKIVGNTGTPATSYYVTALDITGTPITQTRQVPVGNSFLVYYVGPTTSTLSNQSPGSSTVTATGTLNQGTIQMWLYKPNGLAVQTLSKSGTGDVVQGINQVGNPYPSTINLDQVYTENNNPTTGITKTFYELIEPGGTYLGYTQGTTSSTKAGKYVVSGQGFLVVAQSNTSKLTFNETQKAPYPTGFTNTNTLNPGLVMSMPTDPSVRNNDMIGAASLPSAQTEAATPTDTAKLVGLHLQLAKDSLTNTQTGIYFSKDGADAYNVDHDALDLDGTTPKVYLSSYSTDGKRLCINALGDYSKGKRIKLYAYGTTSGTFKISLVDIHNIDTNAYNVYLVDHKMNDSLDMVKYKSYAFNINTADTTTYGANRFTLVIERHAVPPYQLISFSGQKVNNGIQLTWKTINEGTYTNFALQKLGGSNTYASIYTTPGSGSGLYSYIDLHPTTGSNTYRLQQTDIDGRVTYSAPVTIRYNGSMANGTLTIYPNPARSIINVSLNTNGPGLSNYMVDIYNISGTIIDHKTVNTNTWTQDVSNYKLGVYVIQIKTSTGYLVGESKFVKIN